MKAARFPSVEDIVAAGRLADVLAAAELLGRPLPVTRRDRGLPARLRVVYLAARVGNGDGARLLVEQACRLGADGADVSILVRAHPDDAEVGTTWQRAGVRARLRRVPYGEAMGEAVPPCDVIVVGSWEFVLPARMLGLAPVVLFERGDLLLLGDVPDHVRAVVAASLRAASAVVASGTEVGAGLRAAYGVDAVSVPPAGSTGEVRAGNELLGYFESLVAGCVASPPLSGFTVRLGGLRFARSGDAARFRARLGACTTKEIALPVSQPALGTIRAVRWRVVAWRPDGEDGTTRVYLPAQSDRALDDAPEQKSIDLLRAGRADDALEVLAGRCEESERRDQAVVGRWVVLAMLAAGRTEDAAEVASAFARDFPVHPDYVVLALRAAIAAGRPADATGPLERMRLLGVGARFDEWFDDPQCLLAAQLGTGT